MLMGTVSNGTPTVGVDAVVASDGAVIWPEGLDQTLTYNGDGTLNYVQVVAPAMPDVSHPGGTYRQTFGYTNGRMTSVSKWTKQ